MSVPTGLEDRHVAVVVPCFDEEHHVREVVASVPGWVTTIVVVDDASTDATGRVLGEIQDARLVAIRLARNGGVGAAMKTGYRAALERGAELIVKMDGDGQMAAGDLPVLLAPLLAGDADYVKGNRFRLIDQLTVMPRLRMIGNAVLSFLTKAVSGYWSILDPTNGYTAITALALRRIDLRALQDRYFFETSVLIELNLRGAVVRDVDLPARYGTEVSSMRLSVVALQFPFLLARGLGRRFFWRYLMRDFNALTVCVLAGIPLVAFGLIFGGYHWWRSIASGVPATAGTTILAALPVLLGVQCLLVALVLDIFLEPKRPLSEGDWVARRSSPAPRA